MANQTYAKFTAGLDKASRLLSGQRDRFEVLENVLLSRSYALERCKKFVEYSNLLINTFGLVWAGNSYHVFGTKAVFNLPSIVTYNRLPYPPSGAEMTNVLDIKRIDGLFYVIAEFDDSSVHHYYGGNRVTDWDGIAALSSSFTTVASLLAQRINGGASGLSAYASGAVVTVSGARGQVFTYSASTINGGALSDQQISQSLVQAASTNTAEVLSVGTFVLNTMATGESINSITVNGINVVGSTTAYQGSVNATVSVLADKINAFTSAPDYTATAAGNILYIRAAPGTGASPNGFAVAATVSGSPGYTTAAMAGGINASLGNPQVVSFTLTGTFETEDSFTITLQGIDHKVSNLYSGVGRRVVYLNNRLYSPVGTLVYISGLNDFTSWTNNFFSVENYDETPGDVYEVSVYQGKLAVWTESSVQLWNTDQTLSIEGFGFYDSVSTYGTRYPKSVTKLGSVDVYFLNTYNGIRSLATASERVLPSINDAGVDIDPLVMGTVTNASANDLTNCFGVIEPEEQRFFFFLGTTVFAYTNLPKRLVEGWTTLKLPFSPIAGCVGNTPDGRNKILAVRTLDTLYFYGGEDGATYPAAGEQEPIVQPKYLSGADRAYTYNISTAAISGKGVWEVDIHYNPNDPDQRKKAGRLKDDTYSSGAAFVENIQVTTFSPRLVCKSAGEAYLCGFTVYYRDGKEKTGF